MRIPFNKPFFVGNELRYIEQAVTNGWISGDGNFTLQCAALLERRFGIHKVLLTPSCTSALELAAILCGVGAGDEVILPSFTFASTANAFVRLGAKPVFVDIRADNLNIDECLIEQAITAKTKAICPVHYAGVGCDMAQILTIARQHNLRVVEDAAQGVNAFYNERPLGAIGDLGTYSFHETKNFICGEGGALCINSPELVERAEILRDKGCNRKQFLRGQVDKYSWVDVGTSAVPSEICSAFLLAQLEKMDMISAHRHRLYQNYRYLLEPLETAGLLRLPHVPDECKSNAHMFYMLLPDMATRDSLMSYLQARGILAVFHFVPLHSSRMGQSFGYRPGDLPVTEELSGRLLRLPFFYEITEVEQLEVVSTVKDFFAGRRIPFAENQLEALREV